MNEHGAASGASEVALAWHRAEEVAPGDTWLTRAERRILGELRVAKRVADWRLGRWVAKEVVRRLLLAPDVAGHEIEILASAGGAPVVEMLAPGAWSEVALSLSHAGGWGLAAASLAPCRLGCDVEVVAPRSDAFVDDYLTAAEARWVRDGGPAVHLRANLVWSAKESALKALGEGLRMDTRSVAVAVGAVGPGGWGPLEVRGPGSRVLGGWWHAGAGCVWTVVADRPIRTPRSRPD